jgi:hypothetical protein
MLATLTVLSILGLVPSFGQGAPLCTEVFRDGAREQIQHSIQDQLASLRKEMQQLRRDLNENKNKNNRLEALDDIENDPRETAYVLQGAYRLLIAHPRASEIFTADDLKSLEKGLRTVKNLEKSLGEYKVQADVYDVGVKLKMPVKFLKYLRHQRDETSESVLQDLRSHDFLDKEISGVEIQMRRLKKWESQVGSSAPGLIQESLQSEIARVRGKVMTEMKPLILKSHYNSADLEDGAHAFRRSLRWLRVYIDAYRDYFYTTVPSEFGSVASAEKLELNIQEYKLLDKSIERLRKIKKPGEMRERLARCYEQFAEELRRPLAPGAAFAFVDRLMSEKFDDLEVRTQEILQTYEQHEGFTGLLGGRR